MGKGVGKPGGIRKMTPTSVPHMPPGGGKGTGIIPKGGFDNRAARRDQNKKGGGSSGNAGGR